MRQRSSPTALLLALSVAGLTGLMGACARSVARPDVQDPAAEARIAVAALLDEDFESARPRLLALASECRSGEHGRHAVLLLAAGELDPGNAAGSPRAALQLARSYLLLPTAPLEEIVLARALYRLAAELEQVEPAPAPDSLLPGPYVAPRFDDCASDPDLMYRPLPPTSEAALAERVRALEATIAAQSDSLRRIRAASASAARRVSELESELARITELLTSGAERRRPTSHP
ncbi:MAG: hypothetical protein AB7T31_07385 [Gemmatimonadales bacterium]